MQHLVRTHGISIASMHEHFQRDHFVLIYEITAKMAADIHTKEFKNPMAWKKAGMLINLLEPQDLQSKEVLDMLQPSTDVDMLLAKSFNPKLMIFQISLIRKLLYCQKKCIGKG